MCRSAPVLAACLLACAFTAGAHAAGDAPLGASDVDALFRRYFTAAAERRELDRTYRAAVTRQQELADEQRALVTEAAAYAQAVKDHDSLCKRDGLDAATMAGCKESQRQLDAHQAAGRERAASYQRALTANRQALAVKPRLDEYDREFTTLDDQLATVTTLANCRGADAPARIQCRFAAWSKVDGLIRLQLDNIAYRYAYPDVAPAPPPFARRTESLLVGGTGWIRGYYVPVDNPALRQEQQRNLERQLTLAGVSREAFVNTGDYDMIIGIARSHEDFADLIGRVVPGDQMSLGFYSLMTQPLAASLRGTFARTVDCHSNGAMVCLGAILRGDLGADRVRLFGPQITPAALTAWQRLLASGRIKSLEITLMHGDPIAPASFGFGDAPVAYTTTVAKAAARGTPLKDLEPFTATAADRLRDRVQSAAPQIRVTVLDDAGCRARLGTDLFACHDMTNYQRFAASARSQP